jgi:hypothetical protein
MTRTLNAYAVRPGAHAQPITVLATGACEAIATATAMALYGRAFTSARRIA